MILSIASDSIEELNSDRKNLEHIRISIRSVQVNLSKNKGLLVLAGVSYYLVTAGDLSVTLSMVFERGGRSLTVSGVNTSST